jgi:hypothetical protein
MGEGSQDRHLPDTRVHGDLDHLRLPDGLDAYDALEVVAVLRLVLHVPGIIGRIARRARLDEDP